VPPPHFPPHQTTSKRTDLRRLRSPLRLHPPFILLPSPAPSPPSSTHPYLPPANRAHAGAEESATPRAGARRGDVLRRLDAAVRQLLHQEVRDPRANPMSVPSLAHSSPRLRISVCLIDTDDFFSCFGWLPSFRRAGRVFCKKGCNADGDTWEECKYQPWNACPNCLLDPFLVCFSGSAPREFRI
jgi:hypothetical protein